MKKIFVITLLIINVFAVCAQSFTLRGTAVDENNEPIVGLTVGFKESVRISTVVGSNTFEITWSDTTRQYYTLVLWAAGYMTSEYRIDKNDNDLRIVMIKDATTLEDGFGSITGTVKDKQTGEPIPFANIAVISPAGTIVKGCQTDSYGRYTLKSIRPYTYTLQISCIGYYTKKLPGFVVSADKVVQQNIALTPTATETRDE